MKTEISEITIIPIKPNKGLVALATCVLDNKIFLGSIGIYTKLKGGYRLTYPNKKVGISSINIFHPINQDVGEIISSAIISEYEKLLKQSIEEREDDGIDI